MKRELNILGLKRLIYGGCALVVLLCLLVVVLVLA